MTECPHHEAARASPESTLLAKLVTRSKAPIYHITHRTRISWRMNAQLINGVRPNRIAADTISSRGLGAMRFASPREIAKLLGTRHRFSSVLALLALFLRTFCPLPD